MRNRELEINERVVYVVIYGGLGDARKGLQKIFEIVEAECEEVRTRSI